VAFSVIFYGLAGFFAKYARLAALLAYGQYALQPVWGLRSNDYAVN
jgi:hypothetical protein